MTGLLTLLDEHASAVAQTAFPLIAGIGWECCFMRRTKYLQER